MIKKNVEEFPRMKIDRIAHSVADKLLALSEASDINFDNFIKDVSLKCEKDKKDQLEIYLKAHFNVKDNEDEAIKDVGRNRRLLTDEKNNFLYDFDIRKTSVTDLALDKPEKLDKLKKKDKEQYQANRDEYYGMESEDIIIRRQKHNDIREMYYRKNLIRRILLDELKQTDRKELAEQLNKMLSPEQSTLEDDFKVNIIGSTENTRKIVRGYLNFFEDKVNGLNGDKFKQLKNLISKFIYFDLNTHKVCNYDTGKNRFEMTNEIGAIFKELDRISKEEKKDVNKFKKQIAEGFYNIIENKNNIELCDLEKIKTQAFKKLDNIKVDKDKKKKIVPNNLSTDAETVYHFTATVGVLKDYVDETIKELKEKQQNALNKVKESKKYISDYIKTTEEEQKTIQSKLTILQKDWDKKKQAKRKFFLTEPAEYTSEKDKLTTCNLKLNRLKKTLEDLNSLNEYIENNHYSLNDVSNINATQYRQFINYDSYQKRSYVVVKKYTKDYKAEQLSVISKNIANRKKDEIYTNMVNKANSACNGSNIQVDVAKNKESIDKVKMDVSKKEDKSFKKDDNTDNKQKNKTTSLKKEPKIKSLNNKNSSKNKEKDLNKGKKVKFK